MRSSAPLCEGFGFVTFMEKEAGERAIAEMQGHEIKGQGIVVKYATPRDKGGTKGADTRSVGQRRLRVCERSERC